jgi:hypothetical protein
MPYQGKGSQANVSAVVQPTERLSSALDVSYESFFRAGNGVKVYDYTILRNRTIFQLNRHLFVRGIVEYNAYHRRLNADFLASFTYVPGTVIYFGYGSEYERMSAMNRDDIRSNAFLQTGKSFFFKASYLCRF